MDHDIKDFIDSSKIKNIASPAVIVFRENIEFNISTAIQIAGDARRLRPQVKTHKSAAVTALHMEQGVHKFKCSTIAEVLMLAEAGSRDILLSYPVIGPAVDAYCVIAKHYKDATFAVIVDNESALRQLESCCRTHEVRLTVFLDLDVGMHRTGILPDERAEELYKKLCASQVLQPGGLHAYDGHIHDSDFKERSKKAGESRNLALALRDRLVVAGLPVSEIVLGGTPTFPCHANAFEEGFSFSPGTYVYTDWGYASLYPEQNFRKAAIVLGRVISIPTEKTFTVDVGYKAIGSDKPQPRGFILNYPQAAAGPQSEEHWVFDIADGPVPSLGEEVYIWPKHICPTIEHYDSVAVLSQKTGKVEYWDVTARGRTTKRR